MHQPSFTADWFSHNIPTWEAVVSPYLQSIEAPKILEIGAFEGRSTLWFLENFPAARLTVIDPWAFTDNATEDTFSRFKSNIAPYADRVTIMRGKSDLARFLSSKEFDLIYIDGDHRSAAVLHDAVISYELVKTNGLMIFDDYLGGDKSIKYPKPAIDFFHEAYGALNKIQLVSDTYQRIYKKIG